MKNLEKIHLTLGFVYNQAQKSMLDIKLNK